MPRGELSPEHKKALARGRQEAKVVRDYLEALHAEGRRGRPVDRQSLEARIERLQAQINEAPRRGSEQETVLDRDVGSALLNCPRGTPGASSSCRHTHVGKP